MSKPSFVWEDFHNPELKQLKSEYQLDKVVETGKDEFEKQILLKRWIFEKLPLGYNNTKRYDTALGVLKDAEKGEEFNCTWYVLTFLQCAISLGWYVRKLGIDIDHEFGEEESSHTVVDIWSNKYKKWYVVDPNYNAHFEKEGMPLSSYEIRKAHLEKDVSIRKIFSNYEKEKFFRQPKERFDAPTNYFWFFILLRNNYFENPSVYDSKALLWIDKYNENKTWYKGGRNKGEFRKHEMYDGQFVETSDYRMCFPDMK